MDTEATFELLSDSDRRLVVADLLEREGPSTIHRLAAVVAAHGTEPTTNRAKVKLVHLHLPKLRHYGLVDYDERTEEVVLVVDEAQVSFCLGLVRRIDAETEPPALSGDAARGATGSVR